MGSALPVTAAGAWLDEQGAAPWTRVDRAHFAFAHRLAHHELFDLKCIARASEHVVDDGYYQRHVKSSDRQIDKSLLKHRLSDSIARLEDGEAHWLKLSHVEELGLGYRELMHELLAELEERLEVPIRRRMTFCGMTVFMNSPGLDVPYHFDHETNFLLQIRGTKDVYLWDAHDPEVLTQRELERFYRGSSMAGVWRDELMARATRYPLTPGAAVHHPPLAPHMIRNGNQVSVSLSLYYVLPETDVAARIYQANYCMRRYGLRPRAPGASARSDRAKIALVSALSATRPESREEALFSGVRRLDRPFEMIKSLVSPFRAKQPA